MKTIKFRASWVDPGSYGLVKAKEVEFSLGLGPCGRIVTSLEYRISGEFLTVIQTSYPIGAEKAIMGRTVWLNSSREIKEFIYKITDIHGRIVTTS